jgi:hypothetical protein
MFLTDAELIELTGYRQAAAQIRFLQKWRIAHVVNRKGPVVARSAIEGSQTPKTSPNFAALKRVG